MAAVSITAFWTWIVETRMMERISFWSATPGAPPGVTRVTSISSYNLWRVDQWFASWEPARRKITRGNGEGIGPSHLRNWKWPSTFPEPNLNGIQQEVLPRIQMWQQQQEILATDFLDHSFVPVESSSLANKDFSPADVFGECPTAWQKVRPQGLTQATWETLAWVEMY